MNNEPEFAAHLGDRAEAYRSLANHAGVSLEDVVTAAHAGDLRGLVDKAQKRRTSMLRAELESRRFAVERAQLERLRRPNLGQVRR